MTLAPNYRVMVAYTAIDPIEHEIVWLELHAHSEDGARIIASTYLRPNIKILSVDRICG